MDPQRHHRHARRAEDRHHRRCHGRSRRPRRARPTSSDCAFDDPAPIVDSLARALRARGADYVVVVAHAGAFCDRDGVPTPATARSSISRDALQRADRRHRQRPHPLARRRRRSTASRSCRRGPSGRRSTSSTCGPGWQHATTCVDVLPDTLAADPRSTAIVRTRGRAASHRWSTGPSPRCRRRSTRRRRPVSARQPHRRRAALGREGRRRGDEQRRHSSRTCARPGDLRLAVRDPAVRQRALSLTVTGAALRDYLEKLVGKRPNVHMSGVTIIYDSTAAPGVAHRQREARRWVAAFAPTAATPWYSMTSSLLAATASASSGALKSEILPIVDLDAFVAYLRALPQPVRAPTDRRLVAEGSAR